MFHLFFVLLLLQDAFSLNVEFPDKKHSYFVSSKKENVDTNCSYGNNSPKNLFKYVSCFIQTIFSKKLIKQAEQEALDFKDKEVKELKNKLTKIIHAESKKLKKQTEKKIDHWDKLLEKSINENIYKIDKFRKDQTNFIKQKGDRLLSTNIFSFSKNEKGENTKMERGGIDEETEKKKNVETKGSGFWPFSSTSNSEEKVKKEEFPDKEKHGSFLSFFKKEKMEETSQEPQAHENKKEQEGHSSWWFSKKKQDDIKTNELTNTPIPEEKENVNKNTFFGFLKSSKTDEDIKEEEKINEEESTKRKWYNIFSKESTDNKTDMSDSNKEVESDQQQQQQSWWSRNYGTSKNKVDEIETKGHHEGMDEHIQKEEHKGQWWNLTHVFSKGDDTNENGITDEMNQTKETEIEKEKQESDSMFKLWGYDYHKDTPTPEEEGIESAKTKTDYNTYDDTETRRESIIFDIASHGTDANELKDTIQEEHEQEKEQEQKKKEIKVEETMEDTDEDKSKGGITSLFHFNKTPTDETTDIVQETLVEPTLKEDTHAHFFEKLYNYNLEDIHDEEFLSLLNTEYEADPNLNCHPLIVFKVCVHKCFKALDSQHNNEGINTTGVTGSSINNEVGLTSSDHKHLEKCIMKCKKMSFDYVHGGCVQPNGKVLNKKENYKDYLEEMETYNLKLTNNPTTFSDFSLEDKYVDKKIKKRGKLLKTEKQLKADSLQSKLKKAVNGDAKEYAHDIWNMAKEEMKLQMFHKNNNDMQPAFKKNGDGANKTNEFNSNIQNTTDTNSNENKNTKMFYVKSKEFFNTLMKKEKGNNQVDQTEENGSTAEVEKIEFLNHDAYTISDDAIHKEIYARSNSYVSTIFFLILIVLSVCIYFSVFTSIISQFFFTCTEEIASFMRGSYKATFVNIPDSPTEYFLPKNEKNKNYYNVDSNGNENGNENGNGNKKGFYNITNEPIPTNDANVLGANRYPTKQFVVDQV